MTSVYVAPQSICADFVLKFAEGKRGLFGSTFIQEVAQDLKRDVPQIFAKKAGDPRTTAENVMMAAGHSPMRLLDDEIMPLLWLWADNAEDIHGLNATYADLQASVRGAMDALAQNTPISWVTEYVRQQQPSTRTPTS